jgi:hypothetical protein
MAARIDTMAPAKDEENMRTSNTAVAGVGTNLEDEAAVRGVVDGIAEAWVANDAEGVCRPVQRGSQHGPLR